MKINEKAPIERRFTLDVNESELRCIQAAVNEAIVERKVLYVNQSKAAIVSADMAKALNNG